MGLDLLDTVWRTAAPRPGAPDLTGVVSRRHRLADAARVADAATVADAARRKTPPRKAPGADFVEALAHGLALLECWKGHEVWLSNSELSDRCGLTRTTVSRLTSVLVDQGYLAREGRRGRVRLTASTLALGFGSAFSVLPADAAQAELESLARELDVYAALSIRRVDRVQILENVASPFHPDAVRMDVGGLLPLCRSASGLAALSAMPEREAVPLVTQLKMRYGERWDPLHRQLVRTRQEYMRKGYCTSVAALSPVVGAVAMPMIPIGGHDMFVLACGMSAREFFPERVERDIAPLMALAAQKLTAAMAA
ncbi:IclR family transcriptional regulator [Ramlibacter sp.]|uniref:IclR family transcriptional regulator n=1 Tax=Ramlibacter sp. TaxID=1917967 RepID=UPI003D0A1959